MMDARCMLLASRFAKSTSCSHESVYSQLETFLGSDLGQQLARYFDSLDLTLSIQSANVPRSEIACYFVKNEVPKSFQEKTQDVVEAVALLLSIFLQVNAVGPLVGQQTRSEDAVEQRRIFARSLHQDNLKTREKTAWETVVEFWNSCPLGHPDDRVGDCKSARITGSTFLRLVSELEMDGEFISESIRGISYLWAAVQITSCALQHCPVDAAADYVVLTFLMGDVAFVWQQCLEGGKAAVSATLMDLTVARITSLLVKGAVLQTPVELSNTLDLSSKLIATSGPTSTATPFEAEDILSVCKKYLSQLERFYLLVQVSIRLSYFGKPEIARKILQEEASLLAGVRFEFDSVMGKRREHQTVSLPQLVLRVDLRETTQRTDCETKLCNQATCDESAALSSDTANCVREEKSKSTTKCNIDLTELDPTNDLFEYPKLDQINREKVEVCSLTHDLTDEHFILLEAFCYALYREAPVGDVLSLQQLRAVVDRLLISKTPQNGFLYAMCLWFRCQTEFDRSKTFDRALLQLQALADEFQKTDEPPAERLRYVLLLPYLLRPWAALELGRRMMRSGAVLSASELFKELWMWEDAADCLVVAGRKSVALELLEARLKVHSSPRLLCCLGDIHDDPEYYERAWDLSQQRYARAQRSLGRYWFSRQNLEKTVSCFRAALRLNPMFENTWFTLGCCEMNTDRLSDALGSFSRVVGLNSSNGEAWANMAAIHCRRSNWCEAFVCIREAVKYCRENWRIWDSYVKISVKLRDARGCILAATTLLQLGHKKELRDWVFYFLADMAVEAVGDQENTDAQAPCADSVSAVTDVTERRDLECICSFFDLVERQYIADRPAIFMSHARIMSEIGEVDQEFSLRLKELRTALASFPETMSNDVASGVVAPLLIRVIHDVQLTYRRWALASSEATEKEKRTRAEELFKVFSNLLARFSSNAFPHQLVLQELQDAVEFFRAAQTQHD